MREDVLKLNPDDITSEVFIISPAQIEFISKTFALSVAETMNMKMFANKIKQIAEISLKNALKKAKYQGSK